MEIKGAPMGTRLLYYPIQVRKTQTKALLDSGASVNCIDEAVVKQVGRCYLGKPKGALYYPDKRRANVRGIAQLEVRGPGYKEMVSFWVVRGLGVPVLLGTPWLRAWNPTIDWETRQLIFSDGVVWKVIGDNLRNQRTRKAMKISTRDCFDAVGLCIRSEGQEDSVEEEKEEKEWAEDPSDLDLPEWLKNFRGVFAAPKEVDWQGRIQHKIVLKEGAQPCNRKPFRLSVEQKEALQTEIDKFILRKWIRPSQSDWATLALVVPKKDGTMRVCINYRDLNAVSRLDAYPLPRIDELFNRLATARAFSKVDLASGYHQIPMESDSIKYTAFRLSEPIQGCSLYEWKVMPMGLASAPATFQRWMEDSLQGLETNVLIYLDDVLIFSPSQEQHRQDVLVVLQRLQEKKMRVKWEKCEFEKEQVLFLGHQIKDGRISVDSNKLSKLTEWTAPLKTTKQVRQFMGFVSYYRAFIPEFATITAPITDLLRGKKQQIEWTEMATIAMERAKQAMLDACDRYAWAPERKDRVTTDASGVGIGATFEQKVEGVGWAPVAFWSRKMSDAERRYSVTDQEWLAVVEAVTRQWRHWLKGRQFILRTDHSPLRQLLRNKGEDFSNRQMRWFEWLQEFHFDIEHLPGVNNLAADALSRAYVISALEIGTEAKRQKSIGMLELEKAVQEDDKYQSLRRKIETEGDPTMSVNKEGMIQDGGGRVIIPANNALRVKLILESHEPPFAGHFGIKRTCELVRRMWRWDSILADVMAVVSSCDVCQRAKEKSKKDEAPIELMVAAHPWEVVTIDFLSGFVPSMPGGWEGCVVVCDRFSRMVYVHECSTHPTAKEAAKLFIQLVVRAHGIPKYILSDRGAQFESQLWKEVMTKIGTRV